MDSHSLSIAGRDAAAPTYPGWHNEGRAVFDGAGSLIAVAAHEADAQLMAAAPTFGSLLELLLDERWIKGAEEFSPSGEAWAEIRQALTESGFSPDCPDLDSEPAAQDPMASETAASDPRLILRVIQAARSTLDEHEARALAEIELRAETAS